MIPLWIIAAILVAVVLLISASGFAHKMNNRSKRLMDSALAHATGHGSSVKSMMDSPIVKHLPPNVQVKMIANWIDRFYDDHVKTQMKRLDTTLERLNALERSRRKADLGVKFEIAQLLMAKRHLLHHGIGLASVSTQTKIKSGKQQCSKPPKKKYRVRWDTLLVIVL